MFAYRHSKPLVSLLYYPLTSKGTGLVGIVASFTGAKVTLTDQKHMLELLQRNVEENCAVDDSATVSELNWKKLCLTGLAQEGVDIILASGTTFLNTFTHSHILTHSHTHSHTLTHTHTHSHTQWLSDSVEMYVLVLLECSKVFFIGLIAHRCYLQRESH